MSDQWYYASGGQSRGPVSGAQLQQLVATGAVKPTDLVWREGMADWVAASTVPGLLPTAAPVAAAPQQQSYAVAPMPFTAPQHQVPQGYAGGAQPIGYATPPSYYQGGAVAYAGFWMRFAAAFIDGIVTYMIGFGVGMVLGFVIAAGGGDMVVLQVLSFVLGTVINWLYFALQESSSAQATLGKRALGIKVTDLNGQRIGFGQATGRHFAKYLSAMILLIGFMMAGWTQKKQALHDTLANCLVVRSR